MSGYPDKQTLYRRGVEHVAAWCAVNNIAQPSIDALRADSRYYHLNTCGFYHRGKIHIMVPKCAHIGTAAMAWSYPGYIVDRTPFGVLAHELGHHIETLQRGIASALRSETKEKQLTGYCENDSEWFAELFRLFCTNPLLLKAIRPKFTAAVGDLYRERAEIREPMGVLVAAPSRTFTMAMRRMAEGR